MRNPMPAVGRLLLPVALIFAGVTCSGDSTGPTGGHDAQVRVTPLLPAPVIATQVPFDRAVLTAVLLPAETLFVHEAPYAPTDTDLVIEAPAELPGVEADVAVTLELWQGNVRMLTGGDTVHLTSTVPIPAPVAVAMRYVGPGVEADTLMIAPQDIAMPVGDTVQLQVTAADSFGAFVPDLLFRWSSSLAGTAVTADGRFIAPGVRGQTWIHALTPTGLHDSTRIVFVPPATQATKAGGDAQGGTVGDTLVAPLVVLVHAADDLPVRGVMVQFAAVTGDGSVVQAEVFTDSLGLARTRAVLGATAGAHTYTATVPGLTPLTFTAQATAGAAAAIAKQSGDAQADTAGQTLPLPLVARVTDAHGNPVAGVTVTWARRAGTGVVTPDTTVTDALGHASVFYTLDQAGTDTVRATLAGTAASVDFSATALAATVVVTIVQGEAQTDTVDRILPESLAVVLADQGTGEPVAGHPVVWTVLDGLALVSADTVVSDALGRAAVSLRLGKTAGPVQVQVTASGVIAPVTFSATALPAGPHHLAFIVEPPEVVTSGVTLTPAPVVEVRDTFDNAVPRAGLTVLASTASAATAPLAQATAAGLLMAAGVEGTDSLVTGIDGRVTFAALTVAGEAGSEALVFALVGADPVLTHHFTLLPGAPNAVVPVAGEGQVASVDSAVAVDPRVAVTDLWGNVVPGVGVTWSVVQGGGAIEHATSTTDALGQGSGGEWTLGPVPGNNRVAAVVAGLDTVFFEATAEALPPAITLTLRTDRVGVGRTAELLIRLTQPAPSGGVQVDLGSADPGVITVGAPTVDFEERDTLAIVVLNGVSAGTSAVTAAATGYLADTLTVTATANLITLPATKAIPYRHDSTLVVQLGAPAPAGGVVVALRSLDTTRVALLAPNVTFLAGEQTKNVTLRAVRPGSAAIVAEHPDYSGATMLVTSVAKLDILQGPMQVFVGVPAEYVVTLNSGGALAGAPPEGLTATLTARNPTCVAISDSVRFGAGIFTRQDTLRIGAGPFPCATWVVISAPGVAPDSLQVTADSMPSVVVPVPTTDVGAGLQRPHVANLSFTQHGGRNLIVRSLEPGRVVIQPNATTHGGDSMAVFVPNGVGVVQVFVAGMEGAAGDTASVVFEMAGYRPDTLRVAVLPGVISLGGLSGGGPANRSAFAVDAELEALTGISVAANGITNLQPIRAGAASRVATFRVTTPGGVIGIYDTTRVRDTIGTAVFPLGSSATQAFAAGGLRLDALIPGNATLTVSMPGLTQSGPATRNFVITPGIVSFADSVVQVGSGLFTKNPIGLDGNVLVTNGSGHFGTEFTLRVLEPGVALLQVDDTTVGSDQITIVSTSTFLDHYYIAGLEGVLNDTVHVVVSAPHVAPDTMKVVVRRPGLDLQGIGATIGVAAGPRDIFAVIGLPDANDSTVAVPQAIRPGSPLSRTVTFTLGAPGIADLIDLVGPPALVKTSQIQDVLTPIRVISGGVGFDPLAPGGVNLTVSIPGAQTLKRGSRVITVTP